MRMRNQEFKMGCISIFVNVNLLDIFREMLGHFPTELVAIKPDIYEGKLGHFPPVLAEKNV